jgi:subtilisin family serine protease
VVTLWLLPFLVEAQDRYAVFYKYKPQDGLNLDQPQDFLTDRALLRRAKEGVAVDSTDLPVTQRYVDEVYQLSHYILYQSKWLNASLIVTDMEGVKSIAELPFVEKVELVGKGYIPNPNARIGKRLFVSATAKVCPPGGKAERTLAAQELPSDFQNSLLGIDFMHEEGFKGKGIRIAVFDAGFPGTDNAGPLSHLLSNNQLVAQKDFVRPWNQNVFTDNQHGTNVLSLIAAVETESFIAGAPEAEYFLAMTEEVATEYRIEEYNWLRAAEYADSIGVDIINSSLGYYDFDDPEMTYSSGQLDGKTAVITQAANIASSKGILVVNSVGNYGPSEPSIVAPADSPNVLAIGSVNQSLEVSNFSSRGPTGDGRIKPDLAAFGNGVALLRSNGNVGFANGTSFSAPQITALAAGLWQAKPEWTLAELIENILRSASQYENPDNLLGYGIPNFREALYGEILSVEENGEIIPWKVFPNPMQGNKLTIYFGSSLSAEFSLIDLNGKTLQNQSLSRNSAKDPYELQLEGIRPGMYIIQLQDGKLIKQQKLIRL